MSEKTKSALKAAAKIAVLLAIIIFVVLNYDKLKNIDIRALVEGRSLLLAFFIILGVYLLKSVLFVIPAMLVYTSVGMAFSPAYAVAVNLAGIALEVMLTYYLGRFLGREYVSKLLQKSSGGRKILEKKIENRFLPLLIVRALPVFPIDFLSLFLGSMGSSVPTYFFASFIGIAPRVILFTLLGEGIYDYIPMDKIVIGAAAAAAAAIIVVLIKFIIGKKHEKEKAD